MSVDFRYILPILVLIGTTFIKYSTSWVVDDEGCRTPDRGVGNCIPYKNCTPFIEAIRRQSVITDDMKKTLLSYQCGVTSNHTMKVCCPEGAINFVKIHLKTSESTDISMHKNFHTLPKQCGEMDTSDKIINGENAGLFEFPWMALIISKKNNRNLCGGSIINERYILTAAHCIFEKSNQDIYVRVGEFNTLTINDCEILPNGKKNCAPPVQNLIIERLTTHYEYNNITYANDIGLIRVPRISMKKNVKPICLPTATMINMNFEKAKTIVTGWGVTNNNSQRSSILLKVVLPVISLEACQNFYKNIRNISRKQICALDSTKDSCNGDSGGPMQTVKYHNDDVRYVQVGLVSFGPKYCGLGHLPGVYTRIEDYMDWILNEMH